MKNELLKEKCYVNADDINNVEIESSDALKLGTQFLTNESKNDSSVAEIYKSIGTDLNVPVEDRMLAGDKLANYNIKKLKTLLNTLTAIIIGVTTAALTVKSISKTDEPETEDFDDIVID